MTVNSTISQSGIYFANLRLSENSVVLEAAYRQQVTNTGNQEILSVFAGDNVVLSESFTPSPGFSASPKFIFNILAASGETQRIFSARANPDMNGFLTSNASQLNVRTYSINLQVFCLDFKSHIDGQLLILNDLYPSMQSFIFDRSSTFVILWKTVRLSRNSLNSISEKNSSTD